MKWLALLALACFQSIAYGQTTYTLKYANGNGHYPICSTVKIWCGTGVAIGELVNGNWVVLHQNSLGSYSYLFPTYPTAGLHTYGVWVLYKDGSGVLQQGPIDQVTVAVPAKGSQ